MQKDVNLVVSPECAATEKLYKAEAAKALKVSESEITAIRIVRRSVDARSHNIKINLGVEVFIGEQPTIDRASEVQYQNVSSSTEIIIVGAGPAGLFAALQLIELGYKPVIFERGKDVSARKFDIGAIHRNESVNPDSNYGFGEGGAGTFSDGKLYTRSKKRGDVTKILEVLFLHGAQEDILIDAHPHIGTNVLPRVITAIRKTILDAGGEIHFNSRIVELILDGDEAKGVKLLDGTKRLGSAVILATGHSARDVYEMLHRQHVTLEAKNFAVGVRVEHPQSLIDTIQYKRPQRGKFLPPATYNFAEQVAGRGVYSFCMCPGGTIVPAATGIDQLVVNGMSPSSRSGKFANSGIVVEVRSEDLVAYQQYEQFVGLKFQEELEQKCFDRAGKSQIAPAQRLVDFVENRNSSSLPDSSYHPGVSPSDMHNWLPPFIRERLQRGFQQIGQKARGFLTNDAIIVGVESRTSSPVRIPRDNETLEHVKIKRLFPCGEGAGYAGGIVSSAIDGENCAKSVARLIH
jgi:uncharacterized FAD-dependent dehydrogenase